MSIEDYTLEFVRGVDCSCWPARNRCTCCPGRIPDREHIVIAFSDQIAKAYYEDPDSPFARGEFAGLRAMLPKGSV